MNPNFSPDQNPFEAIFAGQNGPQAGGPTDPATMYASAQQGQGAPAQGPAAQSLQGMAGAMGGGAPELPQTSDQPGANPGVTKYVLGAMQQLQKFIAESTDLQDIQAVRGVVTILTRLMQKDQQRQTEKDQQGPSAQGQSPMGMPPAPAPQGAAPQGMPPGMPQG